MGRFLFRRFLWFWIVLFSVITLSFFLMHSVRGGPFDQERALHPAIKKSIEASYHLDWPIWKQYLQYLGPLNLDERGLWGESSKVFSGVLALDFGPSMRMRDFTVNEILAQSFPKSALLGFLALGFAVILGISLGIAAASKPRSRTDSAVLFATSLGVAFPNFVTASVLVWAFALCIPLFPVAGWGSLQHLVLPALALSIPFCAFIARFTREGMMQTLDQSFARTAWAKGIPKTQLIFRHALPGALPPVISYLAPAAAGVLTGSLVIEKIFAIPGMGTHFVQAALNRDYTLALGVTIVYTALVYFLNTLADIAYALLDPRVTLE